MENNKTQTEQTMKPETMDFLESLLNQMFIIGNRKGDAIEKTTTEEE